MMTTCWILSCGGGGGVTPPSPPQPTRAMKKPIAQTRETRMQGRSTFLRRMALSPPLRALHFMLPGKARRQKDVSEIAGVIKHAKTGKVVSDGSYHRRGSRRERVR